MHQLMKVIHAFLAGLLLVSLVFMPLAASAVYLPNACEEMRPCASVQTDQAKLAAVNLDQCDTVSDSKQKKSQEGHCGACCLSHTGVNIAESDQFLTNIENWAVLTTPQADAPMVVTTRIYGLKRPPRA